MATRYELPSNINTMVQSLNPILTQFSNIGTQKIGTYICWMVNKCQRIFEWTTNYVMGQLNGHSRIFAWDLRVRVIDRLIHYELAVNL